MFILWHSAVLVGTMALAFGAGYITAKQLGNKTVEAELED
jgi:hypothetical protein